MAIKVYKDLVQSSRPIQTNSYIVVHNSAGGTAETVQNYFTECAGPNAEAGRQNICAHYAVDDKTIIKMLEDNWNGQHTTGKGYYASWGNKAEGVNNSNSIGIEVADGSTVDMDTAIDNCIELIRYLMKIYNIPISNIVRHGDTQNKNCPATIMKYNKWDFMLATIKERNDQSLEIKFDTSALNKSDMSADSVLEGNNSNVGSSQVTVQLVFANNGYTTVQESLPNANTSDNWVDMHKIKGITLHMYPPYHNSGNVEDMPKVFELNNWNTAFHYKVDYKTKVDYKKEVPKTSGIGRGGNIVGSSVSDFVLVPGEGVYSGGIINIGGSSGSSSSGSSDFTGDTPEEICFNFFKSKGCSTEAACGILGNIKGESGFSTTVVNPTSKATGLCQWLGSRLTNLKQKASNEGQQWDSLEFQLEFAWYEFTGSECASWLKNWGGLEKFQSLTSVDDATIAWETIFERSGGQGNSSRLQYARDFYEKFKNYVPPTSSSGVSGTIFGWPIPGNSKVTSPFGAYRSPTRKHKGIDIGCAVGTKVFAYADGTVEVVKNTTNGYGKYIKINHGGGTYSLYAHLSDFKVSQGAKVTSGQLVALSGNTGTSTGPHLHYEIWKNNIQVDPLLWVNPGGGTKSTSSKSLLGLRSASMYSRDLEENEITYDNIDRSKICFASVDNNQHTYIDRALFNNQNPKYTISIGAFFNDESTQLERSGNVTDADKGWPRTEKVLIMQCAQALYFEGFTSDQLWREFDLNRAPSPFLYLDREKWKSFLVEVDKQVDWLNKKYGKVTGTYVPYNLLTNGNTNDFIEMSPDLGIYEGSDNGSNDYSVITSMQNGLFIGDTWGKGIEEYVKEDGAISESKNGASASYFYNRSKNVNRLISFPSNPTFVYIYIGLSDLSSKNTQELLTKLKNKYPVTPIFIGKLNYVSKKHKDYSSFNEKIDTYNENISSFANANSMYFIDVSSGLIGDNEILNSDLTTSDGMYLKDYEIYYNNIKNTILSTKVSDDSSSNSDNNYDDNSDNDSSSDNEDSSNLVNKYGYIKDTSAQLFLYVNNKYSSVSTYKKYQEVKILKDKNSSGYYKVSVKGIVGYMKASTITVIENNTYGYTYKTNIGKIADVWSNTSIYKSANINSDTLKVVSNKTSCKILDTTTDFYKISLGTNTMSYGGTTGWVKAYRLDISSNSRSINLMANLEDEILADINNKGLKAYIESDEAISMYKNNNLEEEIALFYRGDEFEITDAQNTCYKVKATSSKKVGFIQAKDLNIISKDIYGYTDKDKLNYKCYIKFDNTLIYDKEDGKELSIVANELDEGKIVDIGTGYYKVTLYNEEETSGWIKAYRITTDKTYFNFIKDETTEPDGAYNLVSLTNGDFEGDSSNTSSDTEDESQEDNNTSAADTSCKEGWEEEGDIRFTIIDNPRFGDENRFTYRGDHFARLKNTTTSLAGIKQDITLDKIYSNENDVEGNDSYIESSDFKIRVSAWLKQVTNEDLSDGIESEVASSLADNGITFYILNTNNKIVSSAVVDLPTDYTSFGKRAVLFTDIKAGDYKLFIGGKTKFDIFIDNIEVEQIFDFDKTIEDFIPSGNISTSGVGNTSFDNGGIMVYTQEKAQGTSENAPTIKTIITQEEYDEIMKNADNTLIDYYTRSFEPYDKGLEEILEAPIMEDDRLNTLTETINTFTGNMIRYCVVEAGPGSTDHCVKPADELNVLYKQVDVNVDPIYPDLIIPPNYSTGDYDVDSKNSIPLEAMQNGKLEEKDTLNKQFSFDYKILEGKTKESVGSPINYNDPYPYDDKITELEEHYPKVKIDEIESRLYSCNHPGCPLAHPMAKNFAMLSDMQLAQSKRVEQRLVRLENTLSTIIRNVGRMGSRMNINCVYYGGQDIFGEKY